MSWLRDAWWRLGSRDAMSWPTFWATFAAGLVGGFASSVSQVPLWQRLSIIIAGQVLLWLPLLIARAVMAGDPERSRPGLVLTAFFAGALLRVTATWIALLVLYGPQEVAPVNRITGIFLNLLPAFAVTAVAVSTLRERRRQISDLASARDRIAESLDDVSTLLDQRNEQAVSSVRVILEGELAQLESGGVEDSLAVLQRTVTDVVRPMSHELAQSLPDRPPASDDVTGDAVPWSQVLDTAATGRPFRPIVVGVFMGCLMLVAALRLPANALAYALLDAALIVGLAIANRIVEWVTPGRSRTTRIVVVAAAGVIPNFGLALAVPFLLGTSASAIGVILGFVLLATGATLGSTLLTALARERDRVIAELQESSRALERALVRQRQAQWLQQRALARALHGPVQTAVTAAAIRLDAAIREGSMQPGLIEQIRGELLATLDVLHEAEGDAVNFDRGLARIAATWDGVCTIDSEVSERAESAIALDGVMCSILVDIVTEAVSNAVRHGDAHMAHIGVDIAGDFGDELHVHVKTDSSGEPEPKRRGLGTQLLDECTLSWSRTAGVSSGELSAVLPCSANAG